MTHNETKLPKWAQARLNGLREQLGGAHRAIMSENPCFIIQYRKLESLNRSLAKNLKTALWTIIK